MAAAAWVLWLNWAVCALAGGPPAKDITDLPPPILVHYAYAGSDTEEENAFRLQNLKYFLRHAVTISHATTPVYRVTVSGDRPDAMAVLDAFDNHRNALLPPVHVLQRKNEGYDFGAHWDMLNDECVRMKHNDGPGSLPYVTFIFLNDGVRGPMYPVYMPRDWHWTQAFTEALTSMYPPEERAHDDNGVALAGTSLTCLSDTDMAVQRDPGFIGPKVESFAFAMTQPALAHVVQLGGILNAHATKEDTIIYGEYSLTRAILEAPQKWNVASLLLEHQNMDFRDKSTWKCNDQKFPSRENTYGPGISVSPLEVLFHKARWHNEPAVSETDFNFYSGWMEEGADRDDAIHTAAA